jgi:hypothetical protein
MIQVEIFQPTCMSNWRIKQQQWFTWCLNEIEAASLWWW